MRRSPVNSRSMFSSSTRSSVSSAIVEKLAMSPTAIAIFVTVTSRTVLVRRPGPVTVPAGPPRTGAVNRRERNCSSTAPMRSRSPGRSRIGTARSTRCPLSRVPFVLQSVSHA